ncbi:phosphotransferase [Phlyctema vagabunda]|uniref:Phosphotransferase n=1 Tax=Phlyctema vagabunda TaxID=108571 RepID=A0ABR4PIQ7_9HELO
MATAEELLLSVQDSLEGTPYACTALKVLTGGTGNFVYRGTLATVLPSGEETIVIKHSEGYVALHPDFKLEISRCDFEQSILTSLETLPAAATAGFSITTPRLYYFDSSANTQVYSDLNSSVDLKTYCLAHGTSLKAERCTGLGRALGLWSKQFHAWGAAPAQEGVRETIRGNTALRDLKYAINYAQVVATVPKFPEILASSKEIFEEVAKEVKERIDRDEGTLIHGDFWTGNILLPNTPFSVDQPQVNMYVIDWELVHLGSVAYDLGQIFAELFELKHFKGIEAGSQLIAAFMQGYGRLEDDLAFKVAIHVGVHLIRWGSSVPGWGTQEQVERVVEIGRDFFVQGWKKDKGSFNGTVLDCLFA